MTTSPYFVPAIYIKSGVKDVDFYLKALGAVELRRWSNDDGGIHVVELDIDGALFHLHEDNPAAGKFHPGRHNGVTATIGLMVPDVDAVMTAAQKAGAEITAPAEDYDYGYRQGGFTDPNGIRWMIEQKIP